MGFGEPPPRRSRRLTEADRKRYERQILNLLRANSGRLPSKTIAGHVGIDDRSDKQNYWAVYNLLRSMVKRKLLTKRSGGWFTLAPKFMVPEAVKPWNPELPETPKKVSVGARITRKLRKTRVLEYLRSLPNKAKFAPRHISRQLDLHPVSAWQALNELVDDGEVEKVFDGVYALKEKEVKKPIMPTSTPVPTSDKQVRKITHQWSARMLLGVSAIPLHIREVREILNLPYNTTTAVLSALVKKKQAVRTSRGYYTLALTTQNQDLYEFFEKVNYAD